MWCFIVKISIFAERRQNSLSVFDIVNSFPTDFHVWYSIGGREGSYMFDDKC